jgi:hypothetical protein
MRQIKKSAFVVTVYGWDFGGAKILVGLMQQNDRPITGVVFCRRNTWRELVDVSVKELVGGAMFVTKTKPQSRARARLRQVSLARPTLGVVRFPPQLRKACRRTRTARGRCIGWRLQAVLGLFDRRPPMV